MPNNKQNLPPPNFTAGVQRHKMRSAQNARMPAGQVEKGRRTKLKLPKHPQKAKSSEMGAIMTHTPTSTTIEGEDRSTPLECPAPDKHVNRDLKTTHTAVSPSAILSWLAAYGLPSAPLFDKPAVIGLRYKLPPLPLHLASKTCAAHPVNTRFGIYSSS